MSTLNPEINCHMNPDPKGCSFFVTRKKRFCRLSAKEGEKYCAEHGFLHTQPLNRENIDSDTVRVVCPLDNKHKLSALCCSTCYAHKLKKHLKICNARPTQPQPHIFQGINSGSVKTDDSIDSTRYLNDRDISEILQVIDKVNKTYNDRISKEVTELVCNCVHVEEEIKKAEYGPRTRKHLSQASSLIGIMEKYELFQPDTCYVELGAGKGHLSYWAFKTVEHIPGTSVLLIERASHRHKFDNKLDKDDGRVHRIRTDIADLVLQNVGIVDKSKSVVGFAKHLCGEATDLALRCLIACDEHNKHVLGLTMAFCCHHRCHWAPYVGKEFFQSVGLTKTDFDIMCGMVSWATCGTGKSRDWMGSEDEVNGAGHDVENIGNRYEEAGLTRQEKEEIGRRCKRIIDWGRKAYLEEKGFKCFLHFYVGESVSLENVCITACKIT